MPVASPKKARLSREERRRLIIVRSIDVFARHGFHAATTAEIARVCDVSEALLYQHFSSKKDLFIASMELTGETMLLRLGQALGASQAEATDPSAKKTRTKNAASIHAATTGPEALYKMLVRFMHEHPTLAKMSLMMLAETDDPDIRRAVADLFQKIVKTTTKLFQAAQQAGTLRPDIDAEALSWMNMGAFQLLALLSLLGDDVKFDRTKLGTLIRMLSVNPI